MEVYCEQNIENLNIDKKQKKMRMINIIRYILLIVGIGVCFFLVMGVLNSEVGEGGIVWGVVLFQFALAILSLVPFVVSFIFLGRYINNSNLEFDYLLNSGVFRIIKVINRLRRKKMLEFNISGVESIGKIDSDSYDRYAASRETKKLFAVCDYEHEENIFYIYYSLDGAKYLLHIEPNEEMIMALKRSVPRISMIDKSVKQSSINSNSAAGTGSTK